MAFDDIAANRAARSSEDRVWAVVGGGLTLDLFGGGARRGGLRLRCRFRSS